MCLETFATWAIYAISIVTVICGLSLTGTGAALAAALSDYGTAILDHLVGDNLDGSTYQAAVYMMTVVGPLLFVSAALGCWGACRGKQFWLLLFNIVAGVILALVLVTGVLAAVYQGSFNEEGIQDAFLTQIRSEYDNNTDVQNAWDGMQTNLECCGALSYEDWVDQGKPYVVPDSCCVGYPDEGTDYQACKDQAGEQEPDTAILHTMGCVGKLEDDVQTNADIIMGVCFSLGLLNLIGVLVGCFLRGKLDPSD